MSSRTFTIGRQEAETILDMILYGLNEVGQPYFAVQFVADIVHEFGISDKWILKEWPDEDSIEMLRSYLYPLPVNHPSVRNNEA